MLHPAIFEDTVGAGIVSSLGPAAWFRANTGITVTGLGVSQWDDQSGNARHLLQGTDANRPIGLLHTGTNYLYLPSVSGNYASTPDSAAFPVGNSSLIADCQNDAMPPASNDVVFAKYGAAGQRTYLVEVLSTGVVNVIVSTDGTTLSNAGTSATLQATGVTSGSRYLLKVNRVSTTGVVQVFVSIDSGANYTQVGADLALASGSLFDSTAVMEVGGATLGTVDPFGGRIFRARLYSTIGGTTPVVDFNPSLAADQAATFVASTGETWTINSTGSKPAQIVASSRLLGDGAAHKMATSNYTANQPRTRIALVYPISWTAADYLMSGTVAECGVTQVTGTPKIGLNAGSVVADNTGLTLGAWHAMAAVHNGASSSLYVDTGAATTGNNGANNPGGLTLFSNQAGSGYFNGMFKEVIDFDRALSAAEISRVFRYISRVGQLGI